MFIPAESAKRCTKMTELYLIAHKVRGEVAFDIAEKMEVPDDYDNPWWIIPTSGHRAYPYWDCALENLFEDANIPSGVVKSSMPEDLRDHYTVLEALERRIGRVRPPAPNTDGGTIPTLEDI